MDTNVLLCGMIFSCPLNKNDFHCPFKKVRELPIQEKLRFIKTLNLEEAEDLKGIHIKCFFEKNSS